MPTDSNGNYSLPDGYLAVTGQTILPSQHNPPLEDIAAALTARVMRNGSAPMTGNLPMGGFKVTGLAAGAASGDAVNKAQLDAITGIFSKLTEVVKVDDYTALAEDAGKMLTANKASAIAFTLPAAAGVSAGLFGARNIGAGDLTIDPNGSEQIEGATTLVLKQGDAAFLWSNGAAWRAFVSRRKATQAEAEGGTAADVFMDPVRVRQAVAPMIGLPLPQRLVIATTGNATVDIDAVQVALTDGTNVRVVKNVDLTVNLGDTGANGRDTGAEAPSAWYFFYVIYNPTTNTVAGLGSLSATAPTLPPGYTYARLVGAARNNASSNLLGMIQRGAQAQYTGGPIEFATGTNAGAAISIASYVPSIAVQARARLRLAPNTTSTNSAALGASAATSGLLSMINTDVGTDGNLFGGAFMADILLEAQSLYYVCANGGGAADIVGFTVAI